MVKVESYEVPEGLYFSKDFAWVKVEGDKARIGISDYAQKSLREIVFVQLPNANSEIKPGEAYGSVESVKAVSDLIAPINGTIVEVNDAVSGKPDTINESPFESGWIAVVKPSNLQADLANLMDFNKAVEWHKAQANKK
jgi:glycine cleavage system H protein